MLNLISYYCSICTKDYTTQAALNLHKKRTHSNETNEEQVGDTCIKGAGSSKVNVKKGKTIPKIVIVMPGRPSNEMVIIIHIPYTFLNIFFFF